MTTPFPFVASQVLTAQQLNDIQNLPISDKTASYTLVVADVYKRTIMNNASATTITVNNSIFTVGDVIQVANKGAGTCTITAGAGVTINTSGSLALAQYGGGYLLALSASTFTFFNLGGGGASYGTATGGTSSSITVGAQNYTLLSFTSDTNLVVSKAGLFDVYLVGAGGGGGRGKPSTDSAGGGGGAGELLQATVYLAAATYAVDIGAGGATNTNGFGSCIGANTNFISAAGGGRGASAYLTGDPSRNAQPGGNGGGASGETVSSGAAGSTPNSFAGGNTTNDAGAGGGGQSGAGANSTTTTGSAGGAGASPSTFTGGTFTTTIGVGGAGGNATGSANGAAGGANTGTGGAGGQGGTLSLGGAGGSGRIFVRFKV